MTLTEIKYILAQRGLSPLKRFGQNFLHDQNMAQAIVRAVEDNFSVVERVVEIGPGLGAITEFMLQRGWIATAIEIDKGLAAFLRERFAGRSNFQLIEGDALKVEDEAVLSTPILVGNLPYYISTPLIARWIQSIHPPQRLVLTMQREVAARLAAVAGQDAFSGLSVTVQAEYKVEFLRELPPEVFYPRPEVDSAVVRLDRQVSPFADPAEAGKFREFVRLAFSQRRKKLSNTLGLPDSRRPEEVTTSEWVRLWHENRFLKV